MHTHPLRALLLTLVVAACTGESAGEAPPPAPAGGPDTAAAAPPAVTEADFAAAAAEDSIQAVRDSATFAERLNAREGLASCMEKTRNAPAELRAQLEGACRRRARP